MCIVTRINCIIFTSSFTPSAILGHSSTQYSHVIYIYFVHYLFIHSFLHSLTFPSLSYSFIRLFIHSFIFIVSGGASQGYIVEIVVRYTYAQGICDFRHMHKVSAWNSHKKYNFAKRLVKHHHGVLHRLTSDHQQTRRLAIQKTESSFCFPLWEDSIICIIPMLQNTIKYWRISFKQTKGLSTCTWPSITNND